MASTVVFGLVSAIPKALIWKQRVDRSAQISLTLAVLVYILLLVPSL